MKELRLSEIWIYPIKSLGGIRLNSSKVLPKGLLYDRRWMLVDETNTFMTQRVHNQMALFKVSINDELLTVTKKNSDSDKLSISFSVNAKPKGAPFTCNIWDDTVDVTELDPTVSQWFTDHLGFKCKLMAFPEEHSRPVDPKYKVGDDHVSLADAYPFLIIGQSSLDDLNSRLKEQVPMNRFRPNFVFIGGEPFEEDEWRNFKIGGHNFIGVKPCARCVLTTVNQDTGKKGIEPLATLSTYRKQEHKVLFGQNVLTTGIGDVRVGDTIVVE
jgi:uncharacterized protein